MGIAIYKDSFFITKMDKDVDEEKINQKHQNFKLHLSIDKEQYSFYKDEITHLLDKFINKKLLDQYKFVDEATLLENSKLHHDRYNLLIAAYNSKGKYENDFQRQEAKRLNLTEVYSDEEIPMEYLEKYQKVISKQQIHLNRLKRFREGSQFTIYLPQKLTQLEVLDLCKALHELMWFVSPGIIVKQEAVLSPHISLRQEYDEQGYVPAMEDDSSGMLERQKALQYSQKDAPLYVYLKKEMEKFIKVFSSTKKEKFLEDIDEHIDRIEKSNYGTDTEKEKKLAAIKELRKNIQENAPENIPIIINTWKEKDNNYLLISKPRRFSLFHHVLRKPTETQNLIAKYSGKSIIK